MVNNVLQRNSFDYLRVTVPREVVKIDDTVAHRLHPLCYLLLNFISLIVKAVRVRLLRLLVDRQLEIISLILLLSKLSIVLEHFSELYLIFNHEVACVARQKVLEQDLLTRLHGDPYRVLKDQ